MTLNFQTIARAGLVSAAMISGLMSTGALAQEDQTEAFNAFLAEEFEKEVMRSPFTLTQLGRRERYDEWGDFTDAAVFDQLEFDQRQLDDLHANFEYDNLDRQAQVSYLIFEERNNQQIAGAEFYRQNYPVNSTFSFITGSTSFLANAHAIANVEEAQAYLARVTSLERVFGEIATNITNRTEFGTLPPAFVYPGVIASVNNMITMTVDDAAAMTHPLYGDFSGKVDTLEISDEEKEALKTELVAAITGPLALGYASLLPPMEAAAPLANTNDGVWRLPEGVAYYQNLVRFHTGFDVPSEEVHAFGVSEVARIHDEMREIMTRVGFEGTLQDFFVYVNTAEQFQYASTDEDRERLMGDFNAAIDRVNALTSGYFNLLPRSELEVRRVEAYRENGAPGAFYNQPAPDGSRPGIFYANMGDMSRWQNWANEALVFHEAVPGHHFQIALSYEMEDIPQFRNFVFFTAYVEGWGLYAERLAHEMGAYTDDMSEFGRLNLELWRAMRLVVDTGLHYYEWDRQQAIDYMMENSALNLTRVEGEVDRYLVMPGQALAYKMGMTEILRLRAHAQEELGDAFDIRDFHDVVLGNGTVPMSVLNILVEDYIEDTRGS